MSEIDNNNLDPIIEAALLVADEPLTVERLQTIFTCSEATPLIKDIEAVLERLKQTCETRGVELVKVASGYRFQAKAEYAPFLQKLWEKKPPKYSRALLETLALIIYRQPITRGEIEAIRGVAVSTHIARTLQDRGWIKVIGTRDVPGKPALYGTTKQFLDDFNLKNLSELPPLQALMDMEAMEKQLAMQQLDLSVEVNNQADANKVEMEIIREDAKRVEAVKKLEDNEIENIKEIEEVDEIEEIEESEESVAI